MPKFQIGDVVIHKSNPNQKMVVIYIIYLPIYSCRYITEEGKVLTNEFFEDELLKVQG